VALTRHVPAVQMKHIIISEKKHIPCDPQSTYDSSTRLGLLLVLRNVSLATQPHLPLCNVRPLHCLYILTTDREGPKAPSRLIQARPALSLLMRLPPVGPG
jgi:hypothetical protein